ncbi:MAG: hypothetical protein ACRESZ_14080 [Methylococcales bacterium]
MAKPLPLDERLNVAARLVTRARIFYDIWWFYEGADTRPKILDTMSIYSEFFRIDTHAHLVAMVIYLAGLFESRSDTVNFDALINEAEAAGVSKAAVDSARVLMREVASIPSKIAILRSNLFGHRSASLSYAEAFQKAELKPDQFRDLTVVGLKIANTLLKARGLDEQFFHELSREDVEMLINDLAKANAS